MHISTQKIDVFELYNQAKNPASGAIVMFSGDVRNQNKGKEVLYIDYEAYEPLAEKTISAIIADAHKKWDLQYLLCIHRIGKVDVLESAVVVVTSSVHRKEAYAANRYIIDRVKQEAPIWKHEFFADGTTEWGTNCDCAEPHHHNEE